MITIIDVVKNIKYPVLIKDISRLRSRKITSLHDFDLGFQLKYLKKLGKLGNVTIIGLPMEKKIDYLRIQSIFKKLVAQDIQGS